MKIVLSSYSYAPNIGGIERVTEQLRNALMAQGHRVIVLTATPLPKNAHPDETIMRAPSFRQAMKTIQGSDVHIQCNVMTSTLLCSLVLRKPTIVVHHTWVARGNGKRSTKDWAKVLLSAASGNEFAVSRALADSIGTRCRVMPNPFDEQIFKLRTDITRDQDFLFVGRLVEDKGVQNAIRAMSKVCRSRPNAKLTIAGTGDYRTSLERLVSEHALTQNVEFIGDIQPAAVAMQMQRHKAVLVPSLWQEPFGLVAIEALACGATVICAEVGGLPEAVGGLALSYPPEDIEQLSLHMGHVLDENHTRETSLRTSTKKHLQKYLLGTVASRYLEEIRKVVK